MAVMAECSNKGTLNRGRTVTCTDVRILWTGNKSSQLPDTRNLFPRPTSTDGKPIYNSVHGISSACVCVCDLILLSPSTEDYRHVNTSLSVCLSVSFWSGRFTWDRATAQHLGTAFSALRIGFNPMRFHIGFLSNKMILEWVSRWVTIPCDFIYS
jgi:hypothetical protein